MAFWTVKRGLVQTRRCHRATGCHPKRCVSFSSDGRLLAYLAGETKLTGAAGVNYFRVTGTLWLVDLSRPDKATAVASAAFATSECPLRSPLANSLAFFVHSGSSWQLKVWNGAQSRLLTTDSSIVPSAHDPSFAWSPTASAQLAYLHGDDLVVSTNSRRVRARGVLARIGGGARFNRGLSYSPNGRYLAASVGTATALLTSGGKLVRVVRGHQMGWSGNSALMTLAVVRVIPTLFRFSLATGRGTVAARHFKSPIVTDPAGRWFAYAINRSLFLRRADGSLLRRAALPFVAEVEAAVASDGRIARPVASY